MFLPLVIACTSESRQSDIPPYSLLPGTQPLAIATTKTPSQHSYHSCKGAVRKETFARRVWRGPPLRPKL